MQMEGTLVKIEVLADADSVAHKAATLIAAEAREAVAGRGRFVMAVSGGHTPWRPEDASLRPRGRSVGNGVADPSPGPNAGT